MPQNLSMGYTAFCAEACVVVVKATNTEKVDGNEKWQTKYVIKMAKNLLCQSSTN